MGVGKGGLPFAVIGAPAGMQELFADSRVYCGGMVSCCSYKGDREFVVLLACLLLRSAGPVGTLPNGRGSKCTGWLVKDRYRHM